MEVIPKGVSKFSGGIPGRIPERTPDGVVEIFWGEIAK